MYKSLLIAVSMLVPTFAQEAAPADQPQPNAPQQEQCGMRPEGPCKGMRPDRRGGMAQMGLILEKYDVNKDKKLDDTEKKALEADLQKIREDMKKAPQGDNAEGPDAEGRPEGGPECEGNCEDGPRAEGRGPRGPKGGRGMKGQGPKGQRGPGAEGRPEGAPECEGNCEDGPRGPKGGRGMKGQGPKGQRGPKADPAMQILAHKLFVEKYDADKDGKLSEDEKKAAHEDMKATREAHKAEMDKKKAEKASNSTQKA